MIRFADEWRRFWFEPIDPRPAAALRIAFGLIALLHLAGVADISAYWAPDGLISQGAHVGLSAWLQRQHLGFAFGLLFFIVSLVVSCMMTLGIFSTASVWAALVVGNAQLHWNGLPLSAAFELWLNAVFCIALTNSGAVWSLDAWRARHRPGVRPLIASWPLRLLQIEVALIYGIAGAWKLLDPRWRNGSALHYILSSASYTRFPLAPGPGLDGLLTASTYATILWELAMPILLAWRRTRRIAMLSGVASHIAMGAVLEVGLFTPSILAAYLAFWKPSPSPVSQ